MKWSVGRNNNKRLIDFNCLVTKKILLFFLCLVFELNESYHIQFMVAKRDTISLNVCRLKELRWASPYETLSSRCVIRLNLSKKEVNWIVVSIFEPPLDYLRRTKHCSELFSIKETFFSWPPYLMYHRSHYFGLSQKIFNPILTPEEYVVLV